MTQSPAKSLEGAADRCAPNDYYAFARLGLLSPMCNPNDLDRQRIRPDRLATRDGRLLVDEAFSDL